ncbi:PREDICTED: uncharacterized protein LOC105450173 isoform X1 [Wasmannia auropunctata]|uniref:uncharacterized protein LOC105450173 isoform X1 n=1 Tax=Wasmannia auropunctata TaxID=64793 RepID=UPI0005EDB141|nr:PREDICTED: uncharacterized protein LOC105450173 isoform X1 [Wasmannia auropunctata]
MKGVYLAVFLTIHTHGFVTGHQCFKFTWLDVFHYENSTFDCTKHNDSFTPCITPFICGKCVCMCVTFVFVRGYKFNCQTILISMIVIFSDLEKPNLTDIFEKKHIEQKEPHNVCIRYTYMYDGAAVNISYFQGKVMENHRPITSDCYIQYTEGYSIEVCACNGTTDVYKPCYSRTIRNTHSALITFAVAVISLFMYKI